MERLIGILGSPPVNPTTTGDTFTDRLNCKYTSFILVLFAILVTTKNYAGEPIKCWCPAHFTSSHVEYTNAICWVTNTYYVPFFYHDSDLPGEHDPKERIGYYQWVGLILIAQAILFYIPRIVWHILNKKSGIAVSTLTDASQACQIARSTEERDKIIKYITKHLSRYLIKLKKHRQMATCCKSLWWHIYGSYIIFVYLFIKLLYIINVVGQLFLLNLFLETDYHLYGFLVINRLVNGQDWRTSSRFPRVTLCDFHIRIVGHVNRYTVQCALPVNLFNEYIYIFLWFWFLTIAIVTAISFLFWVARALSRRQQIQYIKSRLLATEAIENSKDEGVKPFVKTFLRRDGVFLVRLIARNSSDLIAAEVIGELFKEYKNSPLCSNNRAPTEDGTKNKKFCCL